MVVMGSTVMTPLRSHHWQQSTPHWSQNLFVKAKYFINSILKLVKLFSIPTMILTFYFQRCRWVFKSVGGAISSVVGTIVTIYPLD